jgi:hypothetical protein
VGVKLGPGLAGDGPSSLATIASKVPEGLEETLVESRKVKPVSPAELGERFGPPAKGKRRAGGVQRKPASTEVGSRKRPASAAADGDRAALFARVPVSAHVQWAEEHRAALDDLPVDLHPEPGKHGAPPPPCSPPHAALSCVCVCVCVRVSAV